MSMVRIGAAGIILLFAIVAVPVTGAVYFTSSAPDIITKGDSLTVSGTGAINGTVGIWIIGRDHFEILTTAPDRYGNFSITLKPSATDQFSSGRYVIIFQDPGTDGILEIEGGTDFKGNLSIMNRGKIITRLGPRENFGENIRGVANQILSTSSLPGIDDIFQARYFFVEEPAIHFDRMIPASGFRLPDQITGERIVISGTTNMGTENTLRTEIHSRNANDLVTANTMTVSAGYPMNTWVWDLEAPGLPPGDYELSVGWAKSNVTGKGIFTVKPPSYQPPAHVVPGDQKTSRQDDYTFPVFVGCSLVVLAIVLYYAGRN